MVKRGWQRAIPIVLVLALAAMLGGTVSQKVLPAAADTNNLLVDTACADVYYSSGEDYEGYSKWTIPGSGTVTVTKLWFWDGNGSVSSGETIYMAMYEDGGVIIRFLAQMPP